MGERKKLNGIRSDFAIKNAGKGHFPQLQLGSSLMKEIKPMAFMLTDPTKLLNQVLVFDLFMY